MPTLARPTATIAISPLDWDSQHFGFSVGRIAAEATDDELQAALADARARRYRLVYWAVSPDRAPQAGLLIEFDGRLVDRKVTFSRSLITGDQPAARSPLKNGTGSEQRARKPENKGSVSVPAPIFQHAARSTDVTIAPFKENECSAELIALAVAAGAYSRFATDSRIPRDKFERLYQVWIERSVRGEIADAVLVARDPGAGTNVAGMITVKMTDGIGNIGLVAVAETHRGRGIGVQLIDAAHRWMVARNAAKTTVVTQGVNAPACRLYERAGYSIDQAENYYHFWP